MSPRSCQHNDAFGRSAFIAGTPHASTAVPRRYDAFNDPDGVCLGFLPNSPTHQVVHLWSEHGAG